MADHDTVKVTATPIDVDDLFGGETTIRAKFKNRDVIAHMREVDNAIDLEFQIRSNKTKTKNGRVELAEEALGVDLWLFDQLCTAVEVETDHSVEPLQNFKDRLSPDFKRTVLFAYRRRIGVE